MDTVVLVEQSEHAAALLHALRQHDAGWRLLCISADEIHDTVAPGEQQVLILSHRPPALDALALLAGLDTTAVPTLLLADAGAETAVAQALRAGI
ncbi:MAG: hypothetical protein KC425_26500, partial [Anaerolineales bacterium]|nr:hypothetical protein [Anaerolineales bacterium]